MESARRTRKSTCGLETTCESNEGDEIIGRALMVRGIGEGQGAISVHKIGPSFFAR